MTNHAYWTVSGGEREPSGKGPVIIRPSGKGAVSVDAVTFTNPDEAYVGRLDSNVRTQSQLPNGPPAVCFETLLNELSEAAREVREILREQSTTRRKPGDTVGALVDDIKRAIDGVVAGQFTGFDTSLDIYEELLLENPAAGGSVLGPLRDEWLCAYAQDHDVIERLVEERIRPADADTARRWYKALALQENFVANRCLSELATDPDERAVEALLLIVWDDDQQFTPQALSILALLVVENASFDEARHSREYVRTQIEEVVTQSAYPANRIAAIEALEAIGEPDTADVLEVALDDSDDRVRTAARNALDRMKD